MPWESRQLPVVTQVVTLTLYSYSIISIFSNLMFSFMHVTSDLFHVFHTYLVFFHMLGSIMNVYKEFVQEDLQ